MEISDLVITTTGGSQGAVGVEWNIKGKNPGDAGMWDVHVRLGGAIVSQFLVWTRMMVHALQGTGVQASTCPTSSQNLAACATAFLGFHITNTGSGYFEVRRPCRSRCGALFTSIHNRTCGSGTPTTILTIPPKRGSTHSALAVSLSSPRRALFGLSEPRLNIT